MEGPPDATRMIIPLEGSSPAKGTLDMEKTEDEMFCMIAVVVVLFFIFVAIAAMQEYKHSNTSVRQFEGTINETAI
ncbi:hypothetical protein L5515_002524 [Caenorhabditis briggsae]|uniref:Uncharacterized protein n=1 Tax=Caenorhabditis briggsae TaxID=6238 RepID=A0AAE9J4Y4_CAEBR|nr:hypothetical protein L5515_002524 [Caenorhabditis briggsae]